MTASAYGYASSSNGGGTSTTPPDSVVFGRTPSMLEVQRKLEMAATANVPVLITGESGTGKEIIARMIHQRSPWKSGPYVKVNCPAIPGTLVESELFGYEKGAFTGANSNKPGRVELAHRGTLFLDEIGEMEMSLQSKLLQLLQDGQFFRIGGQDERRAEVRVVCATNRNLEDEIVAGNFRQDLYFRINVLKLTLPPLRDRLLDLPVLAEYFVDHYNMMYNRRVRHISDQLMKMLQAHDWPGNIRELENLIKRYVIFGNEDVISSDLIGRARTDPYADIFKVGPGPFSLKELTKEAIRKIETNIILQVLQEHHWNRKKAARALKISYRALLYKLQDSNIPSGRRGKPSRAAEPAAEE